MQHTKTLLKNNLPQSEIESITKDDENELFLRMDCKVQKNQPFIHAAVPVSKSKTIARSNV